MIPWYRNYWLWFVILVPLAGVVSGLTLVAISVEEPQAMVVDDYYNAGRAINQDLRRYDKAAEMHLAFSARFSADGTSLVLHRNDGASVITAARVLLAHATLAEKDLNLVATLDGKGDLRVTFPTPISGRWKKVSSAPMARASRIQLVVPNARWGRIESESSSRGTPPASGLPGTVDSWRIFDQANVVGAQTENSDRRMTVATVSMNGRKRCHQPRSGL